MLFSYLEILSLNLKVSKKVGEIKAKHKIQLLDGIIAATAIVNELELATLNLKDFKKIDRVKLFSLKI